MQGPLKDPKVATEWNAHRGKLKYFGPGECVCPEVRLDLFQVKFNFSIMSNKNLYTNQVSGAHWNCAVKCHDKHEFLDYLFFGTSLHGDPSEKIASSFFFGGGGVHLKPRSVEERCCCLLDIKGNLRKITVP